MNPPREVRAEKNCDDTERCPEASGLLWLQAARQEAREREPVGDQFLA